MRKIVFYFFVIINVFFSIFSVGYCKLVELISGEEKARDVLQRILLRITNNVSWGIRLKYDVQGRENIPDEPCVFIANHQSNFDILALVYAIKEPVGFVAKKELDKIPYFRTLIKKGDAVLIDRTNAREGLKAINAAADKVKGGRNMAIFPEGTRSKGSEMGEFKKGSMKIATKAGAKIVPVAMEGAYNAWEKTKGFKKVKSTVIFGEPIDTKEMSREELAKIHDIVRERIYEMKASI